MLVVEDNEINQMVARGFLERMGHCCHCVSDGETALEQLDTNRFDVVLMDVNLPGMSGLEATRRIRATQAPSCADVPIIGISAHVQEEQIAAHLRAGMNSFVAKPVSPERLAKALDGAVRGRQGEIFLSSRRPASGKLLDTANMLRTHNVNIKDFGLAQANAIARLLLEELPEEQVKLDTALQAQEWETLRETAHRMKGAAGSYNLHDMTRLLAELEKCAAAESGETAGLLLRQLAALVPQVRAALADTLKGSMQASPAAQ